jgi:hypothetical protein
MSSPKLWGPILWRLLHSLSVNYPEKPNDIEISNMKAFLISISETIPCEFCKHHFNEFARELSHDKLNSRLKLFRTLYDYHDYVNRNKPGDKSVSPNFNIVLAFHMKYPDIWQSSAWYYMHLVAFVGTDFYEFYRNMSLILPKYGNFLIKKLSELKGVSSFEWTIKIHNEINKTTGKKEISVKILSYYYQALTHI